MKLDRDTLILKEGHRLRDNRQYAGDAAGIIIINNIFMIFNNNVIIFDISD